MPNVSEGRDGALIDAIGRAIVDAGAQLVDVHRDADHHRSVFTFLGTSTCVEDGALALARAAVRLVDLTRHHGVHPRVGAVDVIPFVPLRGSSMADAVGAAHRVGRAFAGECGVPVFFYGEAATSPERRELPVLRRGGFEGLALRLADPRWRPDEGPAAPHPTAGATVIGARPPLIAFNAALDTPSAEISRAVARAIRESSGGLPAVRAMGVVLARRGCAQVSMNLLDYRRTAVVVAARRLEAEARGLGARVTDYELVGCAPADALADWPGDLAPIGGLKDSQLLDPALFAARWRGKLMATYRLIVWRNIPSAVEASDGGETVTRQLSDRFQALIDTAAMQLDLHGSEAYIEQWDRSEAQDRPGSAQEVADAVAADIEARFMEFIGAAFRR